jgi:hypothetical protein
MARQSGRKGAAAFPSLLAAKAMLLERGCSLCSSSLLSFFSAVQAAADPLGLEERQS